MVHYMVFFFVERPQVNLVNLTPSEAQTESYFSPISVDWFIRRIVQVQKSGTYFTFTIATVTEYGC